MGILLLSVTKLVNLSLAEGVFPQKFKKAVDAPHKESIISKQRFELSTGIRTTFHVKIGGLRSCQTALATYQQK